ncbi:P34 probable thiol protease-like [Neltuma alba]|uniref:P34 probable thiol protease-like n=1 Tax=Neltuma alba TaxID=207710 RepID=UPI0010A58586|nr:P34 probable thiol protease-like [Prosopis alba]
MAFYTTMSQVLFLLIWCSILICLSSGFPTSESSVSLSKAEQDFEMFQQWMAEHGRVYPNSEESNTRFQIFQRNLKYITETNAKRSKSPSGYRSCWAFGASGALESVYAITTGKLVSLSEQELVDCDTLTQGCAGGWPHNAFEWVIQNGGISKEEDYPYVFQQGPCKANMHDGDKVAKISSHSQIPESDDALLCAASKQPGIYGGENCPEDSTGVTHVVLIVGCDSKDGTDY